MANYTFLAHSISMEQSLDVVFLVLDLVKFKLVENVLPRRGLVRIV